MEFNPSTYKKLVSHSPECNDIIKTLIEDKIEELIKDSIQLCKQSKSKTITPEYIYQAIELDGTFIARH